MDVLNDELKEQAARRLTAVLYALYAASFLFGITALVAIIVNYVKRDDVAGTFLDSHFRWQIRTFWFGLLWLAVGWLTFILLVGWLVLATNCVWLIYRIVKGWLYLNDGKSMYPQ